MDSHNGMTAGNRQSHCSTGSSIHARGRTASVHDRDALAVGVTSGVGSGTSWFTEFGEDRVHLDKGTSPHPHGLVVTALRNETGHRLRVSDGLDQGEAMYAVGPSTDNAPLGLWSGREHLVNRVITQPGRRPAVIG